jgi:hypothetical protein
VLLQRRIEDIIQQKNIEENFALAMEHNPEARASISIGEGVQQGAAGRARHADPGQE